MGKSEGDAKPEGVAPIQDDTAKRDNPKSDGETPIRLELPADIDTEQPESDFLIDAIGELPGSTRSGSSNKRRKSPAARNKNAPQPIVRIGAVYGSVHTGAGALHAGAVHAGFGSGPGRTRNVPAFETWTRSTLLEENEKKAYVAPPHHAIARAQLRNNRCAFLVGPADTGKTLTQAMLAGELGDSFIEIDGATAFSLVLQIDFAAKTTYLIQDWELGQVPDKGTVQRLSDRLVAKGAYLIATMDLPHSMLVSGGPPAVCKHQRPDPDRVAQAWVKVLAPDDATRDAAQSCLTRAPLLADLKDCLPAGARDIAEYALRIAQGDLTEEAASALIRSHTEETTWHAVAHGTYVAHDRAFLASVAVLNELNDSLVLEAEEALLRELRESSDDEMKHTLSAQPEMTREKKVERIKARLAKRTVTTDLGKFAVDTIALGQVSDNLQPLLAIWAEYGWWRPSLCRWLAALGQHDSQEVRVRAGFAAGRLSQVDFPAVHSQVLSEWVRSGKRATNQALEAALYVLALQDDTSAVPRRLYFRWTGSSDIALGKLGLNVFGGDLGVLYLDEVLGRIPLLVSHHGIALIFDIARALRRLLVSASREGIDPKCFIDAYLRWTDNQDETAMVVTGLLAFVHGSEVGVLVEGHSRAWPLLLCPTEGKNLPHPDIGRLWRRALQTEPIQEIAWDALCDWIDFADDDPLAQPMIMALAMEIIDSNADSRHARRLLSFARNTQRDRESSSGMLAQIIARLSREGQS